ncbi:MAG: peptidylprolyl isomerase [candidate division WOR-3 bacterium]|nr:peptidylprolyl isomerase [candidate division WOR-3 bacterium]
MIMNLRKRAKIVMFIVLVSFAGLMVWGWGADITSQGGRIGRRKVKENVLAVVGKEEVTSQDYTAAYNRLASQIGEEQFKQLSDAERRELAAATWEEALADAIWKLAIERERVTLGEEELREIMMFTPPEELLQDSSWYTDGEFNYQLYWQMLADPDLPPQVQRFLEIYKAELGREVMRSKLRSDVTNGLRLTRNQLVEAQLRAGTKMVLEALFIYELPQVDSNVTRAELQDYYDKNIKYFERKKWWELRTLLFPIYPSSEDSSFLAKRIEDAVAALAAGYDFDQIAMDFTQDSSRSVSRSIDLLDAVEYEALNPLAEGEVSEPYFDRGGWHLAKIVERTPDSIAYQEIYFPLEPGAETRKAVLARIDEFRKRARTRKGNLDSLAAEYGASVRLGPYVRESKDVVMPRFPYTEAVKTYALASKVGGVSEPFPEVRGIYYVFATVDIAKQKIIPLDSTLEYVRDQVIRERAKSAQRDYAIQLRRKIEAGADFPSLVGMPHVSIDTLHFGYYFEAENRYGAEMAGACYALDVGQMAGPVKCDIGYGFFRCLEREFDPASKLVPTAIQNEQTVILNALAEEIFPRKDVKDYRRAGNYYGGG